MSLRSVVGRTIRHAGLGRPLDAAIRASRRVRSGARSAVIIPRRIAAERVERRNRGAWLRAYEGLLADPIRFVPRGETVTADSVPVIICLWNRPERITDVLALLQMQNTALPLRAILWNNNPADELHYSSVLDTWTPNGALRHIDYFLSPYNVGGIGRFIAAKQLVSENYTGPFVTLDDDQDVSESFIEDLLAAYQPHGAAGWWAFRTRETYWDRDLLDPGEDATYVGTGGAIYDSDLVRDESFFTALPPKYGFLEDLWTSHVVRANGWRLIRADTEIEFVLAERDQGHVLRDLKDEFYVYLRGIESR